MKEMEEGEIQSNPSPGAVAVAQPHRKDRITAISQPVTVAAAPPQQTLTQVLPIQQPRTAGNGGGGREDRWSVGATSTLIDAWGEQCLELSRGNLKNTEWKNVADIVSSRKDYTKLPKTEIQCKNRMDTLKKKYKIEKAKMALGKGPSKWSFFHSLDHLIRLIAKSPIPTTPTPCHKVPVGVRSSHRIQLQQQKKKEMQQFRGRGSKNSDSSKSEAEHSLDSADNFPSQTFTQKRPRIEREANSNPIQPGEFKRDERRGRGNPVRELTRAILNFGEAFERVENSKLQQVVEMEKQRMKFAKELELQRMEFFMKTQLEITQLKHGKKVRNNPLQQ